MAGTAGVHPMEVRDNQLIGEMVWCHGLAAELSPLSVTRETIFLLLSPLEMSYCGEKAD